MNSNQEPSSERWQNYRKKIVARVVEPVVNPALEDQARRDVEEEMLSAAAKGPEVADVTPEASEPVQPVHVVVIPSRMTPPAVGLGATGPGMGRPRAPYPVLDPTLFAERHRKHKHNVAYHITQLAMLVAFGAAAAGIVCQVLDRQLVARLCASAALLLGVICLRLVRLTRLSARLRGYAVAAVVLAGIAVTVTLVGNIWHGEPPVPTRGTKGGSPDQAAPRPASPDGGGPGGPI